MEAGGGGEHNLNGHRAGEGVDRETDDHEGREGREGAKDGGKLLTLDRVIRHLSTVNIQLLFLTDGVYGEYRPKAYKRIVDVMVQAGGADGDSVFLDIGFGLGKAVFTAALYGPFRESVGVEIMGHLPPVAQAAAERFGVAGTRFLHQDASTGIPPHATHIFTFSLGMPQADLRGIAKALNTQGAWRMLVTSQKASQWRDLGLDFDEDFEHPVMTGLCMAGSGRQYALNVLKARPRS